MHGSFGEFTAEGDRHDVQETIDKPAQPEFGYPVFPGPVFYRFFRYLFKTGPFSEYGNIAMHLSVHFNTLHYFTAVGFQSAIKIMQFDA